MAGNKIARSGDIDSLIVDFQFDIRERQLNLDRSLGRVLSKQRVKWPPSEPLPL